MFHPLVANSNPGFFHFRLNHYIYMFALTYNLIRLVMLEASRRQHVPLDRISFIDALRWLRDAKADTQLTPLVVNPARPHRLEPRVLKRRMKEYPLMTKPRRVNSDN